MSVHEAILDALAVEFEKVTGVGCQVMNVASNPNRFIWAMRVNYGGVFLGTLYAGASGVQFQWNQGPLSSPRATGRVEYADPAFEQKAITLLKEEIARPVPRWQKK